MVNFSLYRQGKLGDTKSLKSIQKIYGVENPVFSLSLEQLQAVSRFLKPLIKDHLVNQPDSEISKGILTKSNLDSDSFSSEELVFAFFKDYEANICTLFQWRERRRVKEGNPKNTISSMVREIAEFTDLFPVDSLMAKELEAGLVNYLKFYKATQIELKGKLLSSRQKKIFMVEKMSKWLPRVGKRLKYPKVNFAKLVLSYARIMLVPLNEKDLDF